MSSCVSLQVHHVNYVLSKMDLYVHHTFSETESSVDYFDLQYLNWQLYMMTVFKPSTLLVDNTCTE